MSFEYKRKILGRLSADSGNDAQNDKSSSFFLVSKVLVKHRILRDSGLSSWAETRNSETRFQCKSVKDIHNFYNNAFIK